MRARLRHQVFAALERGVLQGLFAAAARLPRPRQLALPLEPKRPAWFDADDLEQLELQAELAYGSRAP